MSLEEADSSTQGCKLCPCESFAPNQWRKTLCKHCFHGYSAHDAEATGPSTRQWYFAKVEGPFTWEQMRHWLEAGYFSNTELLVRHSEAEAAGVAFKPLHELFPDDRVAFLPDDGGGAAADADADADAADYGGTDALTAGGSVSGAATGAYHEAGHGRAGEGEGECDGDVSGSGHSASHAGAAASSAQLDHGATVRPSGEGNRTATAVDVPAGATSAGSASASPEQEAVRVAWMARYFAAGQQWYFLDAEGERQGPFPGDTMTAWFKAGYFWNEQMLLCHHGWDAYVTLESVLKARDDDSVVRGTEAALSGTAEVTNSAVVDQIVDDLSAIMSAMGGRGRGDDSDSADRASSVGAADGSEGEGEGTDEWADGGAVTGSVDAAAVTDGAHVEGGASGAGAEEGGAAAAAWEAEAEAEVGETYADEGYDGVHAEYEFEGGDVVATDDVEVVYEFDAAASEADEGGGEGEGEGGPSGGVDVAAEYGTAAAAGDGVQSAVESDAVEEEDAEGAVADEGEVEWFYADEHGAAQGPFTAQQMHDWYSWDYFGAATLVRHDSCEMFATIEHLFPDATRAFFDDAWVDRYPAAAEAATAAAQAANGDEGDGAA